MSQHDLNITNQTHTNFRQDLNNALEAIASKQSGSGDPTITYPYQEKIDTSASPAVVYIRKSSNDAWVRIGYIDVTSGQLIIDDATDAVNAENAANAENADKVDGYDVDASGASDNDPVVFDVTNSKLKKGTININGLTAETTPAANDVLPMYDASASANRKMVRSDFFKWDYISAETTISAPAVHTFAHGLGVIPTDYQVIMRCKTSEFNWSVGDEILFPLYGDYGVGHACVGVDNTNITVCTGANGTVPANNKSTAGGVNLTIAYWKFVVRARK